MKSSSNKQHLLTSHHVDMKRVKTNEQQIGMEKNMEDFVVVDNYRQIGEGISFTLKNEVSEYRLQVCYSFLLDGVAFNTLRDPPHPLGLRRNLESLRYTLPHREVRDCIATISKLSFNVLKKELEFVYSISIVFLMLPRT